MLGYVLMALAVKHNRQLFDRLASAIVAILAPATLVIAICMSRTFSAVVQTI